MTRGESWTVQAATLLVGGTGLVYAWMLYLLAPADPFSPVHHPWQPLVQHLHVLAAPLLVFATGLIWRRHVWHGWRMGIGGRRRSGVSITLTLVPMAASGYLLQVSVDERWRQVWVIVHLVASGLWLLGFLVHQMVPHLMTMRRARRPASPLR
jgi:hypothetical protein